MKTRLGFVSNSSSSSFVAGISSEAYNSLKDTFNVIEKEILEKTLTLTKLGNAEFYVWSFVSGEAGEGSNEEEIACKLFKELGGVDPYDHYRYEDDDEDNYIDENENILKMKEEIHQYNNGEEILYSIKEIIEEESRKGNDFVILDTQEF